jgi:hypothetical protein
MEEKVLYKLIKKNLRLTGLYNKLDSSERTTIITDTFLRIKNKESEGTLKENIEDNLNYIFIATKQNAMCLLREKKKYKNKFIEVEEFPMENNLNEYNHDVEIVLKQIISSIEFEPDRQFMEMRASGMTLEEIAKAFNEDYDSAYRKNKRIIAQIRRKNKINPKVKNNSKYQVIDIDTNEIIYETTNKRTIESKIGISLHRLTKVLNHPTELAKDKYKIIQILGGK